MPKISRRKFLGGSAALAAAGMMPSGILAALATPPAGNSLSALRHVVIFMQENRSFDHYYGSLRGVRGFDDRTALLMRNGNSVFTQPSGTGSRLPFRLDCSKTRAQCISDLDHSWNGTHTAWNRGAYNKWVAAKSALTMGYYTREDIPFHYALADAFTVCDNYHCSVMGPTSPNRLYLWTGTINPDGSGGGPVISNRAGFSWTTYPERLQDAGISWKVYQNARDNYNNNALAWFTQYRNAPQGTPLYDRGMASVPRAGKTVADIVAAIKKDVLNGTLPSVSWVVAPESSSEHPSFMPNAGADMTNQLLLALTADPAVWASTALFVNYDENDGFFDHMVPPTPPAGTPDEFVNGIPIGLGPRVPMTVISPWSRGGFVCSQVFDHTSVLRFLETWTGVKEPNISAWRRQVCGDLTSAFDFSSNSLQLPSMPDTAALVLQAATQCSTLPAPVPPATQNMPVQESGSRPARPLPYQPNLVCRVDRAAGRLWVTISNTGTESVHHSIHANNYRSDGPWQYDVAPQSSFKGYFSAQTYGGGFYDLSCYGPNGFLRRFAGNINGAGANVEVSASYDLSKEGAARLLLTMTNRSDASVVFTVTSNGYRSDGPWAYTVPAGGSFSDYWNVQLYTRCWYDFTATVSSDALFSRRFCGHVEVGLNSVSG